METPSLLFDIQQQLWSLHTQCEQTWQLHRPSTVTVDWTAALAIIACQQQQTVTKLQPLLGLSLSRTSRLLNELCQQGWLQKQVNPADKREIWVTVVPERQSLADQCQQQMLLVQTKLETNLGQMGTSMALQQMKTLQQAFTVD